MLGQWFEGVRVTNLCPHFGPGLCILPGAWTYASEPFFLFASHPNHNLSQNLAPPIKMDENTLERLPCEMIALILCSFSSFRDLHALINASVVCYRNFVELPERILECVAQNILEPAWGDATGVLVHQRSGFLPGLVPDYAGVKQRLAEEFLLERRDIPNILANQRFFESCSRDFPILDRSDSAFSSLTPQGTLSIKYFYQMWFLGLQFGYEGVETFARRPALSQQQFADLRLFSGFVVDDIHFQHRVCPPRWKNYCMYITTGYLGDMFWQLANKDQVSIFRYIATAEHNILLQLKMISHMVAAVNIGYPTNPPRLRGRIDGLRNDYSNPSMTVKDIVNKYGLSCGWE